MRGYRSTRGVKIACMRHPDAARIRCKGHNRKTCLVRVQTCAQCVSLVEGYCRCCREAPEVISMSRYRSLNK